MPTRKRKDTASVSSSPLSREDDMKDDVLGSSRGGRKEGEQKRRIMMNQYFDELIVLLTQLSQRHIPKKMDKVATLKEAINCLKVYHHLTSIDLPLSGESPDSNAIMQRGDVLELVLSSQDAFMILVSDAGRIMFSNTLVTSLLGYTQTRLIGQNWYDFIHDKDRETFQRLFQSSGGKKVPRSTVTAFPVQNCTLHLKLYPGETGGLPQFLPFKCLAYLRKWGAGEVIDQDPPSPDENFGDIAPLPDEQFYILLVGKLPTSLMHVDLPVGTNDVNFEFELRVSKEGRIISIDKHAKLIIGYNSSEIVGTSFFDYIDPYHLSDVAESISTFTKTGLGVTTPYRIITKSGRYVWLISKTYMCYNPWMNKPDHILYNNRVLGCDQVLPEHRFYRSRKLLPDFDGDLEYTLSSSSTKQPGFPKKPSPPNLQQNPLIDKHVSGYGSSVVGQAPESLSFQKTQHGRPNLPHNPPAMAPTMRMPPPSESVAPARSSTSWLGAIPNKPVGSTASTMGMNQMLPPLPHGLAEIQKELDRKNQEIFEMQQRLLEQQKLFEAERNQFYQVSQQVLQCITANNQQPSTGSTPKFISSDQVETLTRTISQQSVVSVPTPVNRCASPASNRYPSQNLQFTSQSGPPTPQVAGPPTPQAGPLTPQGGPLTPQSAYSPYSPASRMYSPIQSPPNDMLHLPHPPATSISHFGMSPFERQTSNNQMHQLEYVPSQTTSNAYSSQNSVPLFTPCQTTSNMSHTSPEASFNDYTSLGMHNDLMCDTLGLSNTIPQSLASPIVSHIQTLSNMFGGQ